MRSYQTRAGALSPSDSNHSSRVLRLPAATTRCGAASGVVLQAKVSDLILTHQMAKRVLEFRLLDEQIVLRLESRRGHWALVIEGEPFLNSLHPSPVRKV